MDSAVGDIIVGVMAFLLFLIGLLLAAGALDDGIYVFGLSLAGFTAIFLLGLIRRHYDRQDATQHGGAPNV